MSEKVATGVKLRFSKRKMLSAYARHPLRAQTILARIQATRGSLTDLTEDDLACDAASEITDQNHVGGARFVCELARLAEINESTRVLDLGCGLGGAARVLANTFGCSVTGIDVSPERCRDALQLTALVGLSKLVTFQCADLHSYLVPPTSSDVIWGQAAWSHFPDKGRFLRRWSQALGASGRVAFEDACLGAARPPAEAKQTLEKLQERWNCSLIPQQEWIDYLADAGFGEPIIEDQTEEMITYFRKLSGSCRHTTVADSEEAAAWRDAVQLAESGLIRYVRLLARKL